MSDVVSSNLVTRLRAHVCEEDRDCQSAADTIERLRWTLAEVRKEVTAVNPNWNRIMRLFDEQSVHETSDNSATVQLVREMALAKKNSLPWDSSLHARVGAFLAKHQPACPDVLNIVTCLHCGSQTSWSDVPCETCGRLPVNGPAPPISGDLHYVEELVGDHWQRCALGHMWEKQEDAERQLQELRARYGGQTTREFRLHSPDTRSGGRSGD